MINMVVLQILLMLRSEQVSNTIHVHIHNKHFKVKPYKKYFFLKNIVVSTFIYKKFKKFFMGYFAEKG